MAVLDKITRVYQQAKGGIKGYPYIDEDFLNEVIYEFSEFLERCLIKPKFKAKTNERAQRAGIECVKAAIDALNEAKRRKGIYRKMACFDEAKHWIHKAGAFEGELGELHAELRRRYREGWF